MDCDICSQYTCISIIQNIQGDFYDHIDIGRWGTIFISVTKASSALWMWGSHGNRLRLATEVAEMVRGSEG